MAKMPETQTMTLVSPLYVGGTRIEPQQLACDIEADGFTVVSATIIPGDDRADAGIRIVATYPTSWLLSGWGKGRA